MILSIPLRALHFYIVLIFQQHFLNIPLKSLSRNSETNRLQFFKRQIVKEKITPNIKADRHACQALCTCSLETESLSTAKLSPLEKANNNERTIPDFFSLGAILTRRYRNVYARARRLSINTRGSNDEGSIRSLFEGSWKIPRWNVYLCRRKISKRVLWRSWWINRKRNEFRDVDGVH